MGNNLINPLHTMFQVHWLGILVLEPPKPKRLNHFWLISTVFLSVRIILCETPVMWSHDWTFKWHACCNFKVIWGKYYGTFSASAFIPKLSWHLFWFKLIFHVWASSEHAIIFLKILPMLFYFRTDLHELLSINQNHCSPVQENHHFILGHN
jgi:hypothetical protein